jgi:hypothetical protein
MNEKTNNNAMQQASEAEPEVSAVSFDDNPQAKHRTGKAWHQTARQHRRAPADPGGSDHPDCLADR